MKITPPPIGRSRRAAGCRSLARPLGAARSRGTGRRSELCPLGAPAGRDLARGACGAEALA